MAGISPPPTTNRSGVDAEVASEVCPLFFRLARVCRRYLESIGEWRDDRGYRVPGEFVVVTGRDATSESARSAR